MPNLLNQWMTQEYAILFRDHPNFVIVNYTGLDSEETAALRKTVRERSLRMRVVRNRIAGRAFIDLGFKVNAKQFCGQTAVVVGEGELNDPVALTRAVTELEREVTKLEIKGGFAEGQPLDKDGVVALSRSPSRKQLYSQMAGLLCAPVTRFLGMVSAPVTTFVGVLDAAGKKFEQAAQGE